MPSELHLHPDRLRSHAATAAALSDDLQGLVRDGDGPAPARDGVVDAERLRDGALHCARELAELSARLAAVAAAAETADVEVARSLARTRGLW